VLDAGVRPDDLDLVPSQTDDTSRPVIDTAAKYSPIFLCCVSSEVICFTYQGRFTVSLKKRPGKVSSFKSVLENGPNTHMALKAVCWWLWWRWDDDHSGWVPSSETRVDLRWRNSRFNEDRKGTTKVKWTIGWWWMEGCAVRPGECCFGLASDTHTAQKTAGTPPQSDVFWG